MPQRDVMVPKLRMEASFEPATLDVEKRTIELSWYTGARIQRFSFMNGPYKLQFSMDPKAVRLGRMNNGAPLKGGHRDHDDLSGVFGVIEKAWLEDGKGRALARFSERADVEPYFQDVKAGIIRNVSMEAMMHRVEEVTQKGDEEQSFLATDWEPMAVALVAVGADADAHALAQPEEFRCVLVSSAEVGAKKETKMSELNDTDKVETPDTPAPELLDSKDAARRVEDALEADKAHTKEVRRLAQHYNLNEVWAQRHIKLNTPIDQVIADATESRAKLAPIIDGTVSLGEDYNSIGWRTDNMAVALAARAMRKECPEPARQYALSSIAECAFECLSLNGRTRGRNLDARRQPDEVIQLALHGTGDFPSLLANVLNKTLMPAYELADPTFRKISAKKTFKDFRPHRFLRAGDFPVPLQVDEHGEFKHGTMSEGSETATLVTYGRILGLSRQLLVNDDLGALQDIGSTAGRRIADFQNSTFFSTLITAGAGLGPALADALTVYHATHLNVIIAGALDNTRLADGVAKMMIQTSIDGLKLNVQPSILLVSPTNFANALTFVATLTPAQASQVNPFAGQLQVIADANLTGTRFYLLASPSVLPQYIWGSLEGQEGPRVETRVGWSVDGVETKVALDYAVAAIEFRGGATGAGA